MAPVSAGRESWMERRVQNTRAESVRYLRPLALIPYEYIILLWSLGQTEPIACMLYIAVNQRCLQHVGLAEEVGVGWAAWPQKVCLVHSWCKNVCVSMCVKRSDETKRI